MSGKRYPEEFKIEAVKQVVDRGYSVSSVATRLGITTQSFQAWIKRHRADSSTPQNETNAASFFMRSGCQLQLSVVLLPSVAPHQTGSGGYWHSSKVLPSFSVRGKDGFQILYDDL